MMDGDNKVFVNYEEFLRAALGRKDILTDEILSYSFSYLIRKEVDILRNKNKIYFWK